MAVTTYVRNCLFVSVLVLALFGNEPQRVAHAQVGTTFRPTQRTVRIINQGTTKVHKTGSGTTRPKLGTTSGLPKARITKMRVTTRKSGVPRATTPPTPPSTTRRPRPQQLGQVRWNVAYFLTSTQSAVLTPAEKASCAMNQRNTMSMKLVVPTTQVINTTCSQTAFKLKEILVTTVVQTVPKPIAVQVNQIAMKLEAFKQSSTQQDIRVLGPGNAMYPIQRGSFQYSQQVPKKASANSSDFLWMGLTETHLVMIGMGVVILLLFIISVTVICNDRRARGGLKPAEPKDEESNVGTSNEPEKKPKKLFSILKRKPKDEDKSEVASDDNSSHSSDKADEMPYSQLPSDQGSEKIGDDDKTY